MAKSSKTKFDSEPIAPLFDKEEPTTLENTIDTEYDRVGLRLIYPGRVIYDGLVTGEHYEWSETGIVVMVSKLDVDALLNKLIGGPGCCGGNLEGNRLFELVA